MLGISLDSNTPIEEKCPCVAVTPCTIGSSCECCGLCVEFKELYEKIKGAGLLKTCWLTFAPKPETECHYSFFGDRGADEYKQLKKFEKDYLKNNKTVIDYILVAELTNKGGLHFHCYFSFKSKVSVIKTMVQPLYFRGNVLPLYGSQPKKGIHYLFKDNRSMVEYFGEYPPYKTSIK